MRVKTGGAVRSARNQAITSTVIASAALGKTTEWCSVNWAPIAGNSNCITHPASTQNTYPVHTSDKSHLIFRDCYFVSIYLLP